MASVSNTAFHLARMNHFVNENGQVKFVLLGILHGVKIADHAFLQVGEDVGGDAPHIHGNEGAQRNAAVSVDAQGFYNAGQIAVSHDTYTAVDGAVFGECIAQAVACNAVIEKQVHF